MPHVLTLSTCTQSLSPPVSPFSQKHHPPHQSHRKQVHRKITNQFPSITLSLTTAEFHFLTLNVPVILFLLTFFRPTFPYANFGVDGGIGPSGTFSNYKPEWEKNRKEKQLLNSQKHIYTIHVSKGGSKSQTTVPVIFGKAKEPKTLPQTESKCISLYVCSLSSRNHSNNYRTKDFKPKAKTSRENKGDSRRLKWRRKGKRYMVKQTLKGGSLQ